MFISLKPELQEVYRRVNTKPGIGIARKRKIEADVRPQRHRNRRFDVTARRRWPGLVLFPFVLVFCLAALTVFLVKHLITGVFN